MDEIQQRLIAFISGALREGRHSGINILSTNFETNTLTLEIGKSLFYPNAVKQQIEVTFIVRSQ